MDLAMALFTDSALTTPALVPFAAIWWAAGHVLGTVVVPALVDITRRGRGR